MADGGPAKHLDRAPPGGGCRYLLRESLPLRDTGAQMVSRGARPRPQEARVWGRGRGRQVMDELRSLASGASSLCPALQEVGPRHPAGAPSPAWRRVIPGCAPPPRLGPAAPPGRALPAERPADPGRSRAAGVAVQSAVLKSPELSVAAARRWLFGAHSPLMGLSPSSTVELLPIFPYVCPSALPPPVGKSWIDKRIPNCKIIFNNSFALDSTWVHPEESRLFHGHEKPHLLANQVAVSLSRPVPASRPLPTVLFTPQSIPGGAKWGLVPVSRGPFSELCAATRASVTAGTSVEQHDLWGLKSVPSLIHPCHFIQLTWPENVPLRAGPFSDKSRECSRAPGTCTPRLPAERKSRQGAKEDKEPPPILVRGEESLATGSRPVASAPVPGSPWCVVWTGDDRVFFFNPTMQLSVWEKPLDLKNRGDLNRIIEDPPHKRKLEASAADHSDGSSCEDGGEDQTVKTKRNRTEGHESSEPEEVEREDTAVKTPPPQVLLPLEERVTHFRDMLLERGVSAFSTWEKELHKIVFDPRYLLLNSEERKQIFEQFVKTRIKEEYKERKNKLLVAKEEFRKLLEESKVSARTTFKEFAEKYGRDQRFRLVQKKKDQEHIFNQFIQILKKRDKENRLRLRKMR
ncbi:transcription elongation regulator 1-like protein [Orycteropus afer afer]|uniref:Transcription elongation regulator 1-like protein n=1 Tax=Orycteropus afer afer TaxID=1230840 RepID=A0AC54Z6P1_ORYAF|nr:transcription elongation regulator 1-like protein [Orycteropus afer afer]